MYFLLNMKIFHCYVSLPEGNHFSLDRIFQKYGFIHKGPVLVGFTPANQRRYGSTLHKINANGSGLHNEVAPPEYIYLVIMICWNWEFGCFCFKLFDLVYKMAH